jgi:flagellar assembly factor FliW
LKVETTRFGALEVPEETVVTFPDGIPGFAGKRFVMFRRDDAPVVEWMQSLEEPDVAVMTVEPTDFFPDYRPQPKAGELLTIDGAALGPDDLLCRVIIRLGDAPGKLFVNLFAPLFFNIPRRVGMQLPLVGSGLSVREVWPPSPDPAPTADDELSLTLDEPEEPGESAPERE